VTGDDVLLGKPDAAIYRLACNRIGIEPGRLLAVEDAISGIRAAVDAGLRCVGVASHETPENLIAAGAVHVVRDFESVSVPDLESILLRRDLVSHQAAGGG
jgi:beta-phosphoglucomutase-like phosphatase (HAD superfamily)